MYKNILKSTVIFFILVGLFIYAFGVYKTGLTVIQEQQITYSNGFTWTYWKLDVNQYLRNLEYSIKIDQFGDLGFKRLDPPTNNWSSVTKALKTVLNWLIFILNGMTTGITLVILNGFKLVLYPLNIIYALFGLNTASDDWIGFTTTVYNFAIPPIPYV